MALTIYRKQNDTLPDVVVQLSNAGGEPLDTIPVGTTATFKLVAPDGTVVHAAAAATVNTTTGRVTYELQAGDLAQRGDYTGEFDMTVAPIGKKQHVPKYGFVKIVVGPTL